MDAVTDPKNERVVFMTSAQVGKTEILLNVSGYHIDFDPSPLMLLQPTVQMAEAFSEDRLKPMLRDTPALRGKVKEGRSRGAGSTKLHKIFHGGHLTMAGANSPATLASRPIRVLLMDEVDRYPASAGEEGDPVKLAIKRTNNFWNRRIVMASTPTVKGFSRIEKEFELSDKRFFYVPCPHCQEEQRLQWGNVTWPEGRPKEAVLRCVSCSGSITNAQKNVAVSRGRWIATAPFNGIAGFHLNELYSPWRTLAQIAEDYLVAKDDPALYQVWVNTSLGETYDDTGEKIDEHDLLSRCEPWPEGIDVPARGLVLTCGVDTQPDRLEVEVVAWAGGEESWSIDYHVIHGDPEIKEGAPGSPWSDLTDHIRRKWKHESGLEVAIESTCIDSGGHNTQAVYEYVKKHSGERVFAIKGRGGEGIPIVGNPSRKRAGKKTKRPVDVYIVGVDQAKAIIYKRLQMEAPGPGYPHFPAGRSADYFRGLTCEKMRVRYVKGMPKREWFKPDKARNEPLDCRVYAFAALILRAPQFDKVAWRMRQRAQEVAARPALKVVSVKNEEEEPEIRPVESEQPPPDSAGKPKPRRRRRGGGGWINSWR